MLKFVPKLSLVTAWLHVHIWVMWPDCFSLVTRVATTVMSQQGLLHKILTVHLIKIGNKIANISLGKQIKIIFYIWKIQMIYNGYIASS